MLIVFYIDLKHPNQLTSVSWADCGPMEYVNLNNARNQFYSRPIRPNSLFKKKVAQRNCDFPDIF